MLPATSDRLLMMLQDPVYLFYVKIELASYVEGLMKVVKFTYGAESYGQLVFEFGDNIYGLILSYPQQGGIRVVNPEHRQAVRQRGSGLYPCCSPISSNTHGIN
jgi:hypothetical protein